MFFEVGLGAARFVVGDDLRVDSLGDDFRAERARRLGVQKPSEDDRDLVGTSEVEMIADASFEEGSSRGGTVKDTRVGEFESDETPDRRRARREDPRA